MGQKFPVYVVKYESGVVGQLELESAHDASQWSVGWDAPAASAAVGGQKDDGALHLAAALDLPAVDAARVNVLFVHGFSAAGVEWMLDALLGKPSSTPGVPAEHAVEAKAAWRAAAAETRTVDFKYGEDAAAAAAC